MSRKAAWLFWVSVIYLAVGMFDIFIYPFCRTEYIPAVWVVVLSLPLWVKPLARKLNMKVIWEV